LHEIIDLVGEPHPVEVSIDETLAPGKRAQITGDGYDTPV
jgi:hypothetical protein